MNAHLFLNFLKSLFLVLVLVSVSFRPALALSSTQEDSFEREVTTAGVPLVRAFRVEGSPELDGDVLGDEIWENAIPTSGFLQTSPNEGQPASEQTKFWIIYNDDTLYFGVVCYVKDTSTIVVSDSRRDTSLEETDSFRIIIDTYQDRLNGFVFGTNPAGLEYDGQVTNEGQGSGRFGGANYGRPGSATGGSGGGFNLNWDGDWTVSTRISEIGWSAEFAIPFRTLRYPSGEPQIWGLNLQRNIRNRNENAYWAPISRQFNLYRLSLAGEIQDLVPPPQRNLKLIPYLLGKTFNRSSGATTTALGEIGGDIKYSVTPSLTLDLTYNTDFAQVEVDEEQIDLDRFNLFFPEKRPFFLENAGIFSVGTPGQVELFFSRRIGIGDQGQQIPIIGGGRLSGKLGTNTNIGFLTMQTASVDATNTPSNNFTIARVRHDMGRSNLGVLVVNRQGSGTFSSDNDHHRSFAMDGRHGIGENGTVTGFMAWTDTPGMKGDVHAYDLSASYDTESYRMGMGYSEVGPNFNPEVGFYSRRGYRRMHSRLYTVFRPNNFLGLYEIRPHTRNYTVWNFHTGQQETQFTHIDNHLEWGNGFEIHSGLNIFKEGLLTPFEIVPGIFVPRGRYHHAETQLVAQTDAGAAFQAYFQTIIGGFLGGKRVMISPRISMRVGPKFNLQLSLRRNNINLPGGSFITNLGRFRANYSFTPRMFVQALVQYNDNAHIWSSNIRFALLSDANTGLFVVYNDTQGIGSMQPISSGRALTIKYTKMFDLLN